MPISTPSAVRHQINARHTDPIYLLFGDDEAEKARLAAAFAEVVEEELRPFNVDRLYGGEASVGDVLIAAQTVPMMSTRRVVLVLRAERLLMPKQESEGVARDLQALEAYIEAPQPHATVVFVASELDRRRRITSLLLSAATSVDCGGLKDAGDAQRWIRSRVASGGMQIEGDAVRLLVERAGPDIARLRGDVERLLLYATGRRQVTVADVREVAGPAVGHDNWAVTRAIEQGSVATALRELALALEGGAVPLMLLGQLGWVARTKLAPGRVPAAVEALFRTDLDLKTSAGDPRVLLERLVVELCGAAGGPTPGAPPLRRG